MGSRRGVPDDPPTASGQQAGRRYERSVDPAISVAAIDRCALLLAEIAGGTVQPILTDWRGDPPRDDFSPPPVRMAVDLPTGWPGRLPRGACGPGSRSGPGSLPMPTRLPDRHTSELAPRPGGTRRSGRRGAAAGKPRRHPVGAAGRPCRAWADRCAEAAPDVGKLALPALSRCCHAVPSGRGLRPVGLADDDPRRCTTSVLNPLSRTARVGHHAVAGVVGGVGPQRSRGFADVALFSIAQVVLPTAQTRAVDLIPTDRRPTDAEIAHLNASLPVQPVHVGRCWPGCEPQGPWGAGPTGGAADAFEIVRVIARACGWRSPAAGPTRPPWHPGDAPRCWLRTGGRPRRSIAPGGRWNGPDFPKGTCAVELDIDAVPIVASCRRHGSRPSRVVPGPQSGGRGRRSRTGGHRRGARRAGACSRMSCCSTCTAVRRPGRSANR